MARDDHDSEPAYSDDEDFADDSDVAPVKKGIGVTAAAARGGNNENFPNAYPPSDMNSKSANTKAPKRKGGGSSALPALQGVGLGLGLYI